MSKFGGGSFMWKETERLRKQPGKGSLQKNIDCGNSLSLSLWLMLQFPLSNKPHPFLPNDSSPSAISAQYYIFKQKNNNFV
jgi:hypothetical protein